MRALALLIACGVVCALAGYLYGTHASPAGRSQSAARSPAPPAVEVSRTAGVDRGPAPAAEVREPPPPAAAAPLEDLLAILFRGESVPPAVLVRARQIYDEDLRSAAARAAALATREERERRDTLQMEGAGEMPRLLETLAGKGTTLPDLAADGERLLALLRNPAKGPTTGEPDLARLQAGEVEDGATILLPRGTIQHDWRPSSKPFPVGLTLSGVGPEETILKTEISMDRPILSLTLENMTVTSQDLVDARQALTLILRNVRAAGYNTGAGGSNLLDIRGANFALYAEDCLFDGSVGRGGSKHGTPFSLSSKAKILRFTRCTFIENDSPVRIWGTATLHFEACRFLRNRQARVKDAVYRDCVFEGNGDDR